MVARRCAWCGELIPTRARRDARFCGVRCRQASWRFGVVAGEARRFGRSMRFAYADPPYPRCAHYYPEAQEVDHASLVDRLRVDYPDGWALSTSSDALQEVWQLCPEARLAVWFRPVRRVRSARPLQAFEALLVSGGRPLPTKETQTVEDALIYRGRFRGFPGALIGMKPPQFAVWMFRQLGAQPGDILDDLFPGSGAIRLAWDRFSAAAEPSPPPAEDTSARPGGDGSPRTCIDGSPRRRSEPSRAAGGDPSSRTSRDGSRGAAGDGFQASLEAPRDASPTVGLES